MDKSKSEGIWVIEWLRDGRHLYLGENGTNGRQWTSNFGEAFDFGSREEATRYRDQYLGDDRYRVAEHSYFSQEAMEAFYASREAQANSS